MGLRDAAEQLEVCKAESVKLERQIGNLNAAIDITEAHGLILCSYCGEHSNTIAALITHLADARTSPLAEVHPS